MDRIRIRGGRPLDGTIQVGGAKNAALPVMAAALLTDRPLDVSNVPDLADVATMTELLRAHGVAVRSDLEDGRRARSMTLDASRVSSTTADYDLVRRMRASVLVLGPLVARVGEAKVSLPGGCAIGTRPVNLHLSGLEQLGADVRIHEGYVHAQAPRGLRGAVVRFPVISVGATENLMMAATLAEGETVLENVAREPEIVDLAQCLATMGADIQGAGSDRIRVRGRASLGGGTHRVVSDRIEAGSYAMAVAATGGSVRLEGLEPGLVGAVVDVLESVGASLTQADDVLVVRRNAPLTAVDVTTAPFPGFPTDLQAQMMALVATARGTSTIAETIFENRFMHVPELARMGADITVTGNTAVVRGVRSLRAAQVMATDLRASVSLVLAALIADGETTVHRVYHLDRGYERLVEKLRACGAAIERLRD